MVFVLLFLLCHQVFAALGMDPVPRDLLADKSTVIEVGSMPRVRSQDTFGICYSFVAATLLDQANCVTKGVESCSSVPDSEKNSPLDMARYGSFLSAHSGLDSTDRFSYMGINEGGSVAVALYNALEVNATVKESCAPFDHVVAKAQSPLEVQKLEQAMWKKFRDSYESYQKKIKECANCGLEYATAKAQELRENYNLKTTNKDILQAFAQDTYGKFLDRLLIPEECWESENNLTAKGKWEVKEYPQKGKKSDYASTISQIKELLTKRRPVSVGFCAQEKVSVKSIAECGSIKDGSGNISGANHAVIIKGYRKVCRSANDCYEALQIQNSWGESWQTANSDGWVDAKTLLDRSFYEWGALTWLEAKQ